MLKTGQRCNLQDDTFSNKWAHPEYGALCLETPASSLPLKEIQTRTQDLTAVLATGSSHGLLTQLWVPGGCAVKGSSSSLRLVNLNTFQTINDDPQ